MLLPLYKILMEDELEEGEIIEVPILPTPLLNREHVTHDSNSFKSPEHSNKLPFTYKKHFNSHKTHVCKSRKKNVKKCSSDYVRVVKYKVNPNNFKSTALKANEPNKHNHESRCGKLLAVNNVISFSKRRTYAERFKDDLSDDSDYEINKDSSYEDLLNQYKTIQSRLKDLKKEDKKKSNVKKLPSKDSALKRKANSKSPEKPKMLEDKKLKKSPLKVPNPETIPDECIVIDENEDDLDFLRQEALASRMKPSSSDSMQFQGSKSDENLLLPGYEEDNYDVVDMDVSDNDMDDIEILSEHDLNSFNNPIPESDNSDNEDDLLMLRTKLLEGMKEKQKLNPTTDSDIPNINCINNIECQTENKVVMSNTNIDFSENLLIKKDTTDNDLLACNSNVMEVTNSLLGEGFKFQSSENMSHVLTTVNSSITSSQHIVPSYCSPPISNVFPNIISNKNSISTDIPMQSKEIKHNFHNELFKVNDKENNRRLRNIFMFKRNVLHSEILLHQKKLKLKKVVPFIPQEPVKPLVIQLGLSSDSESENDENDSGDNMLASLEQLIESAKNNVDSPAERESMDSPIEHESKNSPVDHESKNSPVEHESKDSAVEHESKDSLIEHESNNSPAEHPSKETSEIGNEVVDCNTKPAEADKDAKLEAKKAQLVSTFQDLLNKLNSACSTFKEDQEFCQAMKLQANKKKSAFVASQLEVNRLKEKLVVAQKTKSDNQKLMYGANAKLAAVQKALTKKKVLIEDLQKECSKRAAHLFGPTYTLPNLQQT